MVFEEVLKEINNKELNALKVIKTSDPITELRKAAELKSLILRIRILKSGSLINNDYYSQVCVTVYDKENRYVFLNDEPNISMETFCNIIIQNKRKINIFDVQDDKEFWESLHIMVDNIFKNNFHVL